MSTADLSGPDPSSFIFLIKDFQLLATLTPQEHTLVVLSKCDIERFARVGGTIRVIQGSLPSSLYFNVSGTSRLQQF